MIFLKELQFTWSSSTVLSFVQILSFLIYIVWWYFFCIDERYYQSVHISSTKKVLEPLFLHRYHQIPCGYVTLTNTNHQIWTEGIVWLPIKGKLLLRFSLKLLTKVSSVPMKGKLLVWFSSRSSSNAKWASSSDGSSI